ncbi:MAG: S1 RNA-binding domain-containing protein [Candidatus Magasanikbacteria bacterium]
MSDEKQTSTSPISAVQANGFAKLLQNFFSKLPKEGELVKGTIISVNNGEVRLDIEGVITGVVRGPELFAESKEFSNLKVGDEIEATILEQENENGEMELSFRAAGHHLVWSRMKKHADDGITVEAKVFQANKGGLMMQVDALVGFMPVSQLSPDNYPRVQGGDKNRILEHLRGLVGKVMQIKVLDANEKDEKLILSEKAVWEDEQKAVLDSFKVGDTVEGEVSALTSFGAFIKFGQGLEGLVHISEIVWQRIDHPRDVLKVGQKVNAQIIDINKSKIYLSIKRLIDDPWKSVKEKYKIKETLSGQIHKIENFGLMVKLDEDIHGLAHISELGARDVAELRERFKIGQKADFEVISIEPSEHRLGLKLLGDKKNTESTVPPTDGIPAEGGKEKEDTESTSTKATADNVTEEVKEKKVKKVKKEKKEEVEKAEEEKVEEEK